MRVPVSLVRESVVEDSVDFVNPQPDQFVVLAHLGVRNQQNAADDPREIAQIEDVVALGRGRQEFPHCLLVDFQRRLHHHLKFRLMQLQLLALGSQLTARRDAQTSIMTVFKKSEAHTEWGSRLACKSFHLGGCMLCKPIGNNFFELNFFSQQRPAAPHYV